MLLVTCHTMSHVAGTPVMNSYTRELVDRLYEDRLATLLSVQDMVEAIVDALEVREGREELKRGEEGAGVGREKEEGGVMGEQ